MHRDDRWSGAGESTRQEVREIFARHAARAAAAPADQRRRPLPGFLSLPARGWRGLSRRGKALAVALAAALAVLVALLVPPALENASENEVNERRAIAANRERIRQRLVEEQRPRRASLPAEAAPAPALAAALAERVSADARERVRAGTLEGPVRATICERITRTGEDPRFATFTCLVERGERGTYLDRDLMIGYRFRVRVELSSGSAVWCKEHPQPLHPDTEEYVKVPVSRACTG
jgi:hypothetical protein